MFTKITNYGGNTYFEYDYGDCPFRYVEVRHIPKDISIARRELTMEHPRDRRRIMRHWAEKIFLEHYFPNNMVERFRRTGQPPFGYQVHHIHPIAMGGHPTDLSNIVIIPEELHDRLHFFMRDWIVASSLQFTHIAHEIPQGHKVFMALPILPPVVTKRDVAFVKEGHMDDEKDKRTAYQLIDNYLKQHPLALYRPRFMRQMDGSKANIDYVWPAPRVERIQEHRLHHTSSWNVRNVERWNFAEWNARQRTGKSGRE